MDGVDGGVERPVNRGGGGIEVDVDRRLELLSEGGDSEQERNAQGREVTPRQTKGRLTWGTRTLMLGLGDLGGVFLLLHGGVGEGEGGEGVGVGGVELGDGGVQEFCEWELVVADAFDDAAG